MISLETLAAVLAGLLLLAPPAQATERPHARDGFTAGINLGVGSARAETDGAADTSGAIAGGAGSLRIGYAVSPAFVLSLEGIGWSNESFGVTQSFSIGGLGLTWFPNGRGFYIKGILGEGSAEYQPWISGNVVRIDENGSALSLGIGHEWRVARRLALGPAVDLVGVDFDRGSASWVNFTFGLQFYL